MNKVPARRIIYVVGALGIIALAVFLLLPGPVPVDAGKVEQGAMGVTVDDQGETRSHDRFVISAPVAGRLMRIELDDGDAVAENQVIAQIAPVPLSARERTEQTARVAATEALAREANEHVRHAEEDLAQATRERQRVEKLVKDGFMSPQAAEQARNVAVTAANEAEAARFRAKSAVAEVRVARAGLIAVQAERGVRGELVQVRSPVAGYVLRIPDKSERVVAAGTPLLTLGDLKRLEVVIELLSSEAVKVKPGMPVVLDGWGGNDALRARVRSVEPFAFTKVSALGVEEKRTNVIVDFVDPPGPLGDGFRVIARIITWSADKVLKVPSSALFRCEQAWCVFAISNGRAQRRTVEIGHRNPLDAEVLQGLSAGEQVIRHPGNQIEEGGRVRPR